MASAGIRVASYNTHGGVGRDGHFVPKRIADVLKELDADIIALQEVESRATGFDMLRYLGEEIGFEAIAGPTLLRNGADYGNGLLTRFNPAITPLRPLNFSFILSFLAVLPSTE